MRKLLVSILVFFTILITGCRTAPIYGVNDAAIPTGGKSLTLNEVESGIVRAGEKLGWTMRVIKPGEVQGTLALRTHTAIVSIPYTQNKYSIIYKSSVNLAHDGDQIHSNYNGWVQNLERRINVELGG